MKVSVFITCLVDQSFEVGMSMVTVLRKLGVEGTFRRANLLGQPRSTARLAARRAALQRFIEYSRNSEYIVAPSGSCTSMVRFFYKELFNDDS